jgi:hypothetical protein
MTTLHRWKKNSNKGLLIAVNLIWIFCFSCRSQTLSPGIFEPAAGSPVAVNCGPGNIVVTDLNKDGRADFVVVCAQTRALTIFTGKGNGRFEIAGGGPVVLSYAPHEIVAADMNHDGNTDLVVGSHDSYRILILMGDGKGNFDTASGHAVIMRDGNHPHTHGLGVADLNGDGFMDIVTANSSDNDVSVMLGNGSGKFNPAPGSPLQVAPAPYPLTIGDLNGDGHQDIVSTTSDRTKRAITVLTGDGIGNFRRKDIPLRTPSPWYVAIGDINNDTFADMVMTHSERNELTVLTGTQNGDFTEVAGSPFNLGHSAWHVAIKDVNGDKYMDVLAAANDGIRLMLGNGTGKFSPAEGSPFLTGKGTWHFGIGDVNADGRPDIISSNLESKNISVLLGK